MTRVWDLVVRVCHWGIALGFVLAYLTHEGSHPWHSAHNNIGLAVLALLAIRLIWACVSPNRYARFSQFVKSPMCVWRYTRSLFQHQAPRYLGHNPLGGYMVLALWASLGVCTLTGWLGTTDRYWGLAWVNECHELSAQALLFLIPIHLLGVLHGVWVQREPLLAAMWHGKKSVKC
jgi:cytochrome b